jgi:hypothetical protein
MKRLALTLIALAGLAPATASADGLPLPIDGADHATVGDPDGSYRYGAVSNGDQTTVLKIAVNGGQIVNSRTFGGEWSVPIVANDGTASGLAADGDVVALINPRQAFPRETTEFRTVNAGSLRPQRTIKLDGDFSFDAISRDGSRLYLVHYLNPRDPFDYEVRAYDVEQGKLLGAPIVDPDEPDEQMAGYPMARQTSPDGRWAYTLYAGGEETFIHALDTGGLTAQCIDLEGISPRNLYKLNLNIDPASGELTVLEVGAPVALVDPETFEVSEPAPAEVPAESADPDGGASWVGWAAVAAGLLLVGALGALLWRRRPVEDVDEEALERLVRIDAEEREREEEREPVR